MVDVCNTTPCTRALWNGSRTRAPRARAQALRTKETLPLLQAARRALLLTGTPALSRPRELLTQVQALLPLADVFCLFVCLFVCLFFSRTHCHRQTFDFCTQVQALLPGAALTMRAFGERYCQGFSRFGQYQGARPAAQPRPTAPWLVDHGAPISVAAVDVRPGPGRVVKVCTPS